MLATSFHLTFDLVAMERGNYMTRQRKRKMLTRIVAEQKLMKGAESKPESKVEVAQMKKDPRGSSPSEKHSSRETEEEHHRAKAVAIVQRSMAAPGS